MDDTDAGSVRSMRSNSKQKNKKKKRDRSESSNEEAPSNVSPEGTIPVVDRGSSDSSVVEMAEISEEARSLILSDTITKKMAKDLLDVVAKYESVIVRQCSEIARLEGRLEERRELDNLLRQTRVIDAKTTNGAAQPVLTSRSSPTYAIVVRNAAGNDAASNDDLKQRVLDIGREVGPVKVKSVRTLKDGGVAVVASSRADVQKIRAAPQFAAAGLALTDPKMSEPKLLISDVPADVTNERLIGEVLPSNLATVAKADELQRCRVVSRMARTGGTANVVVEVPEKLGRYLVNEGRLYIEFNSCRVREYHSVTQCYGCGSFGHLLARCTLGRLCHNCGEAGHESSACTTAAKCRNCSLGGLPAGHRVNSVRCPYFVKESERRRNRVVA